MTDKEKELAELTHLTYLKTPSTSSERNDCLAAAKAARAWSDHDEFQNGDEVEFCTAGCWIKATYIGKDPRDTSCGFVIIDNEATSWSFRNIRRPRKTITRAKQLNETTAWLCDNGYTPDGQGDWY